MLLIVARVLGWEGNGGGGGCLVGPVGSRMMEWDGMAGGTVDRIFLGVN